MEHRADGQPTHDGTEGRAEDIQQGRPKPKGRRTSSRRVPSPEGEAVKGQPQVMQSHTEWRDAAQTVSRKPNSPGEGLRTTGDPQRDTLVRPTPPVAAGDGRVQAAGNRGRRKLTVIREEYRSTPTGNGVQRRRNVKGQHGRPSHGGKGQAIGSRAWPAKEGNRTAAGWRKQGTSKTPRGL